jgi:hypothetical protein
MSENHSELGGKHDRDAVELPSRRGSRLGLAGDRVLLSFLGKSPSDRLGDVVAATRAIDELEAAMRPQAKPDFPSGLLLGDKSLIRYSAGASMSVVLLTTQMRSPEDAWVSGAQSANGQAPVASLLPRIPSPQTLRSNCAVAVQDVARWRRRGGSTTRELDCEEGRYLVP